MLCASEGGESWFHAHAFANNSVIHENNTVHMPENKDLNRKGTPQMMLTLGQYKSTCGHELGHIMGLDDAYTEEGTSIDRMTENEETCVLENGIWYNIMLDSSVCFLAKTNDIEMILRAYDKTIQQEKETVRQSYKDYVGTEGEERKISDAIKNQYDEEGYNP